MSKETKGKIYILLWKISIILTAIFLIISLITENIIYFIIAIFLGIMMHIIPLIGSKYVNYLKKTTAEKYQISINEYKDISSYFNNYKRGNIKINDDIYGDIYYKIDKKWYDLFKRRITLIATINMKIYDGKTKNLIMEKINNWLTENIGERNGNNDYLEVALVLCLDKINDKFKNYINQDIFQDHEIIILPVGIVLDEKNMYIRVQKEAYLKSNYQKLKKKFLDTIDYMLIK